MRLRLAKRVNLEKHLLQAQRFTDYSLGVALQKPSKHHNSGNPWRFLFTTRGLQLQKLNPHWTALCADRKGIPCNCWGFQQIWPMATREIRQNCPYWPSTTPIHLPEGSRLSSWTLAKDDAFPTAVQLHGSIQKRILTTLSRYPV